MKAEVLNILKWNVQGKPISKGDKRAKRLQILMRTSEFTNGKAPILYQFHMFLNLNAYTKDKWIPTY